MVRAFSGGNFQMAQAKPRDRIIDAVLQLAEEHRWEAVSLEAIAARAGVTLAALRAGYDSRTAILADFVKRTDERVLSAADPELAKEALRERLFDVLFTRIETLRPHKKALRSIGAAARRDPLFALELNGIETRAMGWMLTASGISATGPRGVVRAQGLTLVWAKVMRTWFDDDDPGLARTMADLDKRLRQAERSVLRIERLRAFICGCCRRERGERRERAPGDADLAEGHPS